MSNWGDGYRSGFRAAIGWVNYIYKHEIDIDEFLGNNIYKDPSDNGPSFYAVANKCCGGVDAHDVGCGR